MTLWSPCIIFSLKSNSLTKLQTFYKNLYIKKRLKYRLIKTNLPKKINSTILILLKFSALFSTTSLITLYYHLNSFTCLLTSNTQLTLTPHPSKIFQHYFLPILLTLSQCPLILWTLFWYELLLLSSAYTLFSQCFRTHFNTS